MNPTRSELVAYLYPDGRSVCIDCDIYPPGTADIRVGEEGDRVCSICGCPLTDVEPLSGKVDLS